jgi:hypothetical protein
MWSKLTKSEKFIFQIRPRPGVITGDTITERVRFQNIEIGPQERTSATRLVAVGFNPMEIPMKKFLTATAALTLMCGSAFAQGTAAPAAQQDNNITTPGMTNMEKDSMDKGAMKKGSMDKGTTGMSKDGVKEGSMTKDGMKK